MRMWLGVALSLVLHIILSAGVALYPPQAPQAVNPITIEILKQKQPSQKNKTIVRKLELPNHLLTDRSQDPLRFHSERTFNVKEQTRAKLNGLTENRVSRSPAKHNREKSQLNPNEGSENKTALSLREVQNFNSGFSTIAEDLPDQIKVGSITALNTDRYLYYSYFARSEERIYNEWAPDIRQILENPPNNLRASVQRKFTTLLEAWYFPSGALHSIHIMKPSGIPEFDRAAENSFKVANIIPNPPREKIEADGLIRFQWSMSVEYSPKVLVRDN